MIKLLGRFAFNTIKQPSVAVFNTKKYDIDYLTKVNTSLPEEKQVKLSFFAEQLNENSARLAHECDTVCCFVNDKVSAQVLRKLSSQGVNLVALRCAGFNNVDLKEADKLGINVVRVPAYSPEAVAEFSMALLLSLNRKIHKAYNRTRDHNFALDGLVGSNLHGKTIGLIGLGKIGICFTKICKGFGMNVVAYDPHRDPKLAETLGFTYVDESDIFYQSDYISLHCPLTPQTRHIINDHSITKMKENVMIINTGRGALIETKAVVNALKKKKIGGLAIDVYEQEEKLFFKDVSQEVLTDDVLARLLSFPNVIITGHQAFFTHEALMNISQTTLNNIYEFKVKGSCVNQVHPS
ncbi:unnamed protein product (macronuclear) [Paramecium tetraurelia]|uniref:D-lactate dehydrogenase n=1 Tax=Paramecium tetraurelia TaxID=5888 RepID=A0CM08_PARTE|nr:uncharacterized protein GSPATT00008304001 [Paramecium tetraurelia]CAK71825.1 unnamed protein product [Paramecium tetraurelia]|eukprot:XP_001439222.1 hypothetical protein (macronuclear) [Paramecium tetraurelia strain d4-2]